MTQTIDALPMTLDGRAIEDFKGIWRVVCVKGREEKAFVEDCALRRIGYFHPQQQVRRGSGRTKNISHVALLPGFAFCCTENDEQFYTMQRCRSFRFVLQETLHPDPHSALSCAVQKQLRRDLQWHYIACVNNAHVIEYPIEVGKLCRIKTGMFMNYEGRVARYNNRMQIEVVIEFMCRKLTYEIDPVEVEVLDG